MVQNRYGGARTIFNWVRCISIAITGAIIFLAAGSAQADDKLILALGDSLTAGLGLSRSNGFVAQLESRLILSGIGVRIIDGGVSGDTSAGGLARLDWLLATEQPDLVIVELGANDGLRGLDPSATMDNLEGIVMRVKARGAKVLLAGMQAPPNMGRDYTREFNRIYELVARKHDTALFPFFLNGVAAHPQLNQSDGIHPNAEGVAIIVEQILPLVTALLAVESG